MAQLKTTERRGLRRGAGTSMRALVYGGPARRRWEERPKPSLREPSDALVRIVATTICGTDLHILKGDVPEVEEGRVLGHEGIGVVEETGPAVLGIRPGDLVLISCITSCGRCDYCRRRMYSHCRLGGWRLGHTLDGTQAEYVRVPLADGSLHKLPASADPAAATMLSDILPTAYECGVLNGRIGPGDTVAIVGAGPIGLAAVLTARLFSPAEIILVDTDEHRLSLGRQLGATRCVDNSGGHAVSTVMGLTEDKGVDVAIEAVGLPETFDACQRILAPGGRLANIGVHGRGVNLRLDHLWSHNVTITTRLVDTESTPMLLQQVLTGRLDPRPLVTHRFDLDRMPEAYEAFASAASSRAMKVLLLAD